ncbi:hypothetical protein BWQ96_01307 [Gracilariopsis chorda]|uniref:Uncharacterized protein n=1 Tax=Gracilariopsis chorda TaxID=448386 RepID=A0A2V3J3J7_9FLOR|nr:hypothetical protein BWQ96_01307 [Gracilariopsis chorda]|eukprot:PXF48965.1 hypothetical protein BWQ96_01307 [Gracilariopsis chorda]
MSNDRAHLKVVQTIDGEKAPIASRISNDARVVLVARSDNTVQVYSRPALADDFEKTDVTYKQHQAKITALALQDGGAQAASGDADGNVHVWLTSDTAQYSFSQRDRGAVVDLAISEHFLLVSFKGKTGSDGSMQLISKGLNVQDEWKVIQKYEGGKYSKCMLSERLKLHELNLAYYHKKSVIYERNPQSDATEVFDPLEGSKPYFMFRNVACRGTVVIACIVQGFLMLWAPKKPAVEKQNPQFLTLRSDDNIILNNTLSASSVFRRNMFLVTIFDQKVHVIVLQKDLKAKKSLVLADEPSVTKQPNVMDAMKEMVRGNPDPVNHIVNTVEVSETPATAEKSQQATQTKRDAPSDYEPSRTSPVGVVETSGAVSTSSGIDAEKSQEATQSKHDVSLEDEAPRASNMNVAENILGAVATHNATPVEPAAHEDNTEESTLLKDNMRTYSSNEPEKEPTAEQAAPREASITTSTGTAGEAPQDERAYVVMSASDVDNEDEEEIEEDPEALAHDFWGLF